MRNTKLCILCFFPPDYKPPGAQVRVGKHEIRWEVGQ